MENEHYEQEQQPLHPTQQPPSIPPSPSTPSRQEKQIKGWLGFIVFFVIGAGAVLSLAMQCNAFVAADTRFTSDNWIDPLAQWADLLFVSGFFLWGIYTVIAFSSFKPNAVFLGKCYFIFVFASNLLLLYAGNFAPTGFNSFARTLASVLFAVVWFVYLSKSPQVNRLFPKEERQILKRDRWGVFLITLPYLILFSVIIWLNIRHTVKEAMLKQIQPTELNEGEYTDGKIIFQPPEGVEVVMNKADEYTFFVLSTENSWGSLLGEWVYDPSDAFFDEYKELMKPEEYDDFDYELVYRQDEVVNGSLCRLETIMYYSEPTLYWTFAMLYDKESEKTAIMSLLNMTEEFEQLQGQVYDLLEHIRFRPVASEREETIDATYQAHHLFVQ